MRKASRFMIVAVMAACIVGASVTVASAFPAQTSRCDSSSSGCHAAGAGATVVPSLVSTSATSATYNLAMTGSAGSSWAVFDGTTRVAGAVTSADTFVVDLGKTYNVFAVDKTSNSYVTTSVSTAAPSVVPTASLDETIPPVTTCDALASYVGPATVKLMASDGAGRGVAYIYYSIDGARVHLFTVGMVLQTSVNVPAPLIGTASHTIEFWAQDLAGNVEGHKSATFTVAASSPVVKTSAKFVTPAAPSSVRHGSSFTVYGYMTPRHASGTTIEVRFYRYRSGHGYVYYKTLRPKLYNSVFDNYSKFLVKTSLPYAGKWRIRSVHVADALHLTSYSNYEYLTVR